jgi:thioredoxin reductase/ferredoxin
LTSTPKATPKTTPKTTTPAPSSRPGAREAISAPPAKRQHTQMQLADLFEKKRPEPSYPTLPACDDVGETSVRGLFVVGEAAGTPLLKLGINAGAALARHLRTVHEKHLEPDGLTDVIVIGAGAAGLSCALQCQRDGLSVVVVEGRALAQTVVDMYRGKHLFAEPLNVKLDGPLWLQETDRETLLARWQEQVRESGVVVCEHEPVSDVQWESAAATPGRFAVTTSKQTLHAKRVVLAVGKAGNPRKAGAPGEAQHAARIKHTLSDPQAHQNQDVVVYGGGDVACEAALALMGHNRVTLITIDEALTFPKKRNKDAIDVAVANGTLTLLLATKLEKIDDDGVTAAGRHLKADVVFEMIGAEPPVAFFRKLGLALDGAWTGKRIATALVVFLAVYALYALKKFPDLPHSWPFPLLIDKHAYAAVVDAAFSVAFAPFMWMFSAEAMRDLHATLWFQQGYLYSLAYTIVMIVFGRQALTRWTSPALGGASKDPRYQRYRYGSLLAFQIVFFLLANVIAVQGLSLQYAWRAWGLYQPWPLFFNTFHWWNESDPRAVLYFFIGFGLLGTFVAIPVLSWKNGKRFCTWVCGCGGLAETLGDRWRHLAPKGKRSRAWEVQSLAVLVAAAVVTLVSVGMYQTRADNPWALAYSYVVDFWLVAVIPIGLYPFFGGKIWCRYWCPLAAWNQLLSKWYGRLAIVSNDQCISCGQCSKQCQVGVDVMAFARQAQRFDNANSSCIHCGICVDVCPVDVLSFSTATVPKKGLPIVS